VLPAEQAVLVVPVDILVDDSSSSTNQTPIIDQCQTGTHDRHGRADDEYQQ